jgi:RNA polymerase sigma-70 factor (ECF subfamily)
MSSGLNNRQPPQTVAKHGAMSEDVGRERGNGADSRRAVRDVDWSILMARAQAGDGEAYRRLLEDIAPYARSLAARRHRDPRDVEDTVQDVLLTVHSIRHTYDPRRPFTPWLVAIAHRRAIDRLRQQGRARDRDSAIKAEHETFDEVQANVQEARSGARALHQAVESLPAGQRQAVKLLKLQELSMKQAAEVSGMSTAALKVATHRALKNLRKILGSERNET